MVTIQERIDRIEKTSEYQISERDAFLEAYCEVLDEQGQVICAEGLAEVQSTYDLAACQQFIEDNNNG